MTGVSSPESSALKAMLSSSFHLVKCTYPSGDHLSHCFGYYFVSDGVPLMIIVCVFFQEIDCIVNHMMTVAEYLGWDVSELKPVISFTLTD